MRPKRLISLLVAVCMMITMLPLSAVTAFAADTSTVRTAIVDGYKYEYTINTEDDTATITKFLGPVDSEGNVDFTNHGPYDINIPSELDHHSVTGLGDYSFATEENASPLYDIHHHYIQSVTIPQSVTSIGASAFANCSNLRTITIPEKVTTIESDTFTGCSYLESITLPAGLKSFQDKLENCPAGNPDGAIYYKNYKAAADDLLADNDANDNIGANDKLRKRNFLYLCKVTFDAKGGTLTDKGGNPTDHAVVSAYKTEKINADDLAAIPNPTRAGYNFTGWYTTADGKPADGKFDVDKTEITKDITLYAGWEPAPKAPVCHPLTLKDGVITSVTVPGKNGADPEDITEIVKKNANEDGSFHVPEGATVSVAFDKDAFADSGLKFGHWDITGLDDPNAYQDKESFAFEMPAKAVTLKAMTQDASIEDDEPDIVGPIVIGTTVVVGGAVLGYQAYSLGAEFAGKLLNLPYFPSNRSALAMMLWEDAGKPMPESELLYPDVGQEERDMDLQHAARWAMENELIPDLNDEGTAPEEMKFYPDNAVSKIDVLNAWQKAQELKQNA